MRWHGSLGSWMVANRKKLPINFSLWRSQSDFSRSVEASLKYNSDAIGRAGARRCKLALPPASAIATVGANTDSGRSIHPKCGQVAK